MGVVMGVVMRVSVSVSEGLWPLWLEWRMAGMRMEGRKAWLYGRGREVEGEREDGMD